MVAPLILDSHKLSWHTDRIEAWERGERIAPVMIDMALTRECQAACSFCYAMLQENEGYRIDRESLDSFLDDSASMGVRAICLMSDGESTITPLFEHAVVRGKELGISMASGTNLYAVDRERLEVVLPYLDYIRVNIPAGTEERYCAIMGVKPGFFRRVLANLQAALEIKRRDNLAVTVNASMVLMPQDADQILPFARLALDLGVDYAIIKHCSDDRYGTLGVRTEAYGDLNPILEQAEAMSNETTRIAVKYSKMEGSVERSYRRCYGPPFQMQISGSGLVAPCGPWFNAAFTKYHLGNICEQRWMDIWQSEHYWNVMRHLASPQFDTGRSCATMCLQHNINKALDGYMKGERIEAAAGPAPLHLNFL